MFKGDTLQNKVPIVTWASRYDTTAGKPEIIDWRELAERYRVDGRFESARFPSDGDVVPDRIHVVAFTTIRDWCDPENCDTAHEKGAPLYRHRCNRAVMAVHALGIDHDAGTVGFDDAVEIIRATGLAAVVYETKSSTPDAPRWRAIFPLAIPWESPDTYSHAYRTVLPVFEKRFGCLFDRQCSSPAQAWATPSLLSEDDPPRKVRWIFGRPLDLHTTYEAIAPEPDLTSRADRTAWPDIVRGTPLDQRLARAVKYVRACDPAIQGQGGSPATLMVAAKLVRGFCIDEDAAFSILREHYNPRCMPPWSDKELRRKAQQARLVERIEMGSMLTDHPLIQRIVTECHGSDRDLFRGACTLFREVRKGTLEAEQVRCALAPFLENPRSARTIEKAREVTAEP